MRSICKECKNREYVRFELDSIGYVGGAHWCNAYKKPITEVKICYKYKKKEDGYKR